MPIVTTSFFVRDINIPNTTSAPVAERLNSYIARIEPVVLNNLLGYSLSKLFAEDPSSERMMWLRNGKEFTGIDGNLYYWRGLVHDTDQSLIAYYIYYEYMKDSASMTIGTGGTAIPKNLVVDVVPAIEKMTNASFSFFEEAKELIYYLWSMKDIDGNRLYPEFTPHTVCKAKEFSRPVNQFGL